MRRTEVAHDVVRRWTFSDKAFLVAASLATTALYVSYALPIVLGARARSQGRWQGLGPWNLGKWGIPTGWLAGLWTLVVVAVFAVHVFGLVLLVVLAVLGVTYHAFVRGKFTGPKVDIAAFERDVG